MVTILHPFQLVVATAFFSLLKRESKNIWPFKPSTCFKIAHLLNLFAKRDTQIFKNIAVYLLCIKIPVFISSEWEYTQFTWELLVILLVFHYYESKQISKERWSRVGSFSMN